MKEFSFSQNWYQFLVMAVVCYLIGCFNFARFISRWKKKDITKMGSGNPGTMNMSREFGWKVGVLTFFCDAFKGGVPLLISYFIYRGYYFSGTQVVVSDVTRYFCGLFVIVGHVFPAPYRFKGGKGIASTLGLFWMGLGAENPWMYLIVFAFFWLIVLYIYLSEWGGMGSLIGVSTLSVAQCLILAVRYANIPFNAYMVCPFLCIFIINLITWIAHWKNVCRLLSGEEHHTSVKKLVKKKKKKAEENC